MRQSSVVHHEIMAKKVALLEVQDKCTNVTDSSALCTESPYPEPTRIHTIGGQRSSERRQKRNIQLHAGHV